MIMYNSTESILKYIDTLHLSTVYVEENFPLPLYNSVKMPPADALNYLLGGALAGNKVMGFFHEIPVFIPDKPLRGQCLLVSTQLPRKINIPVFICRQPEAITETFALAFKVSADISIPVQVIISPNTLNNYTQEPLATPAQDKGQPYLNRESLKTRWTAGQKKEKFKAALVSTMEALPLETPREIMNFDRPETYFPDYVFPYSAKEIAPRYKGLKKVLTSSTSNAFLTAYLNGILGLEIEIEPSLEEITPKSQTYLCPGCPFPTILKANDNRETEIFTSIKCPALHRLYTLTWASCAEYTGLTAQKTNLPTAFIGNASEISACKSMLSEHGTFIGLLDTKDKPVHSPAGAPSKFKHLKNSTFPYSCGNIKKYSKIKTNPKKCICTKSGNSPKCIEATHCPALSVREEAIYINPSLCTGCRLCSLHCTEKAIS